MRPVSKRCQPAQRARELLQDAHDACFNAPGRDVLGMSTGPFSGVNEVLGLIAQMDAQIADLEKKLGRTHRKHDEMAEALESAARFLELFLVDDGSDPFVANMNLPGDEDFIAEWDDTYTTISDALINAERKPKPEFATARGDQ